ncbi:MAG: exopolysaccharide biosynthesis polyprenyl glycosylphosphotransferase [Thermoleophilaceae bacterium]
MSSAADTPPSIDQRTHDAVAAAGLPADGLDDAELVPVPPATAAALRALRALSDRVLVPLVGAVLVGLLSATPYEGAVLAFLAFLSAGMIVPPRPPWTSLLRFARVPLEGSRPAGALAILLILESVVGIPSLTIGSAAIVLVATTVTSTVSAAAIRRLGPVDGGIRTAVIGSDRSAVELVRELRLAGVAGYVVVGRIALESDDLERSGEAPVLGTIDDLGTVVERDRIGLLVMTSDVPRARVFDEVARSCLHLPVRLWELTGFFEDVFGHVPVAEMNAAWFQYIMHPRYSPITPGAKRALDVLAASALLIAILPLLAACVLLIRLDGGPAFFTQLRIGEGGRPLRIYKLRTMRAGVAPEPQWASPEDPRVTRIGRLLRRLHLDELPQLVNVLRGEMSIVGPRPEQPEFVERLERMLPFYSRRHLIKPGITGWAQVRCGYAGSDLGSGWKLCHDLYYLKHRSMVFDLAILAETLRTVFTDPYQGVDTSNVAFIHGGRGEHVMPDHTVADTSIRA